ncbi:SMC-Scp complex subunit ScpB [Pseudoalteromonas ruthenica]|uniref:SMC-Scp complex subunit ScpB n=1 Tax=Pseudoalteromonas ruthenica TaxID=151081 RepID=UPI0012463C2E|nr:SMC-Scp complex subunit ScpB [Pseudoalteromonas ruthenica]
MSTRRISDEQLIELLEAAIFVAPQPLTKKQLKETVLSDINVSSKRVNEALEAISAHYQTRGIRLVHVGSGYRFQACSSLSPWLSKLFQERAPKYSRALMETLSLIAYRQPITRGEIEQVRGVTVASNIMKTLQERGWVKVIGHKEVPGRPALYATTNEFLDYFSLSGLEQLPPLPEQQQSQIDKLLHDPSVREPSE